MNWKVTYRTRDGGLRTTVFQASNRADLFRLLAEREILATRVVTAGTTQAVSVRNQRFTAAATLYLAFRQDGAAPTRVPDVSCTTRCPSISSKKNTLSATTQTAEPRERKRLRAPSSTPAGYSDDDPAEERDIPPEKRIVEVLSISTNHDGSVLERFYTADGKIRSRQSAPPAVFDNESDQVLALAAAGAASGGAMPPFPPMADADAAFRKSLEREIIILDGEPEDVKELKRSVIAYREEMRKLVEAGHSVADVLREHRELVNRDAELRAEGTRLVKGFLDRGDEEGARLCLKQVNAELAAIGAQEIEMPLSREERRARARGATGEYQK